MIRASVVAVVVLAMVQHALLAPTVDSSLLRTLREKSTVTVIVSMRERTGTVLDQISGVQFASRGQRLNAVAEGLRLHAQKTQSNVLAFLRQQPHKFQSLWITNQIVVRQADLSLVEMLSQFPEVASITEEMVMHIGDPMDLVVYENVTDSKPNELQWGVQKIQADRVWTQGNNGQGIVVATVDTGVRYTHEALKDNFRAEYGWFDPSQRTPLPNDGNGHGTHTTGTIAGTVRGIGVAPGAQWIACKGCSSFACFQSDLLECGQFMACPTQPDGSNAECSKAPHLVSNSWGGGRGSDMYVDVIRAWRTGGILPLFSIGNSGPSCNTANSPGDNENVIGVGSTTEDDDLSSFSSVGPTFIGQRIKPDISAPGSNVVSAYHTSDNAYASLSGTSMACPHAAGASALALSANQNLSYDQVKALLEGGSEEINSRGIECAGIPDNTYPNHHAGYGRINALSSVTAAKALLKN